MNADGVMQTDWIQVDGHWYYMNADGIMQTGWIQLKGIWYYLKPSGFTSWSGPEGSMLYSTTVTIDGVSYTFNADGACMNP